MRKAICVILACLLFCCAAAPAYADNRQLTVYIASGSSSAYRYHARASCSSLSRSSVAAVTLEDAASRGFTPCTKCRPPSPDFDVSATPRPKTGSSAGYHPAPVVTPVVPESAGQKHAAAVSAGGSTSASVHTSKNKSSYSYIIVPAAAAIGFAVGRKRSKSDKEKPN